MFDLTPAELKGMSLADRLVYRARLTVAQAHAQALIEAIDAISDDATKARCILASFPFDRQARRRQSQLKKTVDGWHAENEANARDTQTRAALAAQEQRKTG